MKTLLALCVAIAAGSSALAAPATTPSSAASNRFEIHVTKHGFEPANLTVPAKTPVTIVFDRTTDNTCIKEVVIAKADGTKLDERLPLNKPVEITTTFAKAGTLTYACAMDMMHGILTVK